MLHAIKHKCNKLSLIYSYSYINVTVWTHTCENICIVHASLNTYLEIISWTVDCWSVRLCIAFPILDLEHLQYIHDIYDIFFSFSRTEKLNQSLIWKKKIINIHWYIPRGLHHLYRTHIQTYSFEHKKYIYEYIMHNFHFSSWDQSDSISNHRLVVFWCAHNINKQFIVQWNSSSNFVRLCFFDCDVHAVPISSCIIMIKEMHT